MRALLFGSLLFSLGACGGASSAEVRYDADIGATCIRHIQPAETGVHVVDELKGSFDMVFVEDHYSYMGLILVVGYGRDRATASSREHRLREALPEPYRSVPVAWSDNDGNIVYEALGPTTEVGGAKVLPRDVTVRDDERLAEEVSQGMRKELENCLAEALRN